MAVTEFTTSSAQTVKRWSNLLFRESIYKTYMKKFMGAGKESIIRILTDLEKNAGDTIKYDLLAQMNGYGVTGDNVLKGYEEPLVYYQDSLGIDQLRQAHAFRRMSQQRTLHDLKVDAKNGLADWFANRFDELLFGQLAGSFSAASTAPSAFQNFGGNTLVTPITDASHYLNKQTETFRTGHIEALIEKAQIIAPIIEPTRIDGMDCYVLVVHPNCITDLRTDATNSQWIEITKHAYMGKSDSNPFFTGAVGMWGNVVIYASSRIPILNPGASQYARCLFMGRGAGVIAFGNAYDKIDQSAMGSNLAMAWNEQVDDYGNEKGISGGAVFGVKPCIFNSARFGLIVAEIKAASH